MPVIRSVSTALRDFYAAHAAFLVAAEVVRAEIEKTAGVKVECASRGDLQRRVRARLAKAGVLPPAAPDVRAIQSVCAEHFRISLAELCSQRRDHDTAWARFSAFTICREMTHWSAQNIGLAFARTECSGVSYGCTAVAQRAEVEPDFAAQLNALRAKARLAIQALPVPRETVRP